MANKMLIDAAHPEETRVVVLRGNRVEEFDFESASRKQLRGNIYLAKVTRVEPSLQAAFVDYGGNRHGFLAFSEIHPDYYQIPVADRQALIEAEEARDRRGRSRANDRERGARTRSRARAGTRRQRSRGRCRRGAVGQRSGRRRRRRPRSASTLPTIATKPTASSPTIERAARSRRCRQRRGRGTTPPRQTAASQRAEQRERSARRR